MNRGPGPLLCPGCGNPPTLTRKRYGTRMNVRWWKRAICHDCRIDAEAPTMNGLRYAWRRAADAWLAHKELFERLATGGRAS